MGVDAQVSGDFFDDLFYRAGLEVVFQVGVFEAFCQFGAEGVLVGFVAFAVDRVFHAADQFGSGVGSGLGALGAAFKWRARAMV